MWCDYIVWTQCPIHCKKSSFLFIQTIFCKQLYSLVFFVRFFFFHFIAFGFGFVFLFSFFNNFFFLFVVVINLFLLCSSGWLLFGCSPFAVRFLHRTEQWTLFLSFAYSSHVSCLTLVEGSDCNRYTWILILPIVCTQTHDSIQKLAFNDFHLKWNERHVYSKEPLIVAYLAWENTISWL